MVIEHGGFRERGYSGGLAERDMLGSPFQVLSGKDRQSEIARVARFKQDLIALQRKFEENGYLPFDTAMQFCREHQAEDPLVPSKPFLQELFKHITDIVTESFEIDDIDIDDLRFFSSVDTPLDIFHGIDGWIEIKHPKTGAFVSVTLDVTQNLGKLYDGHKADVIVQAIDHYPTPPRARIPLPQEVAKYCQEMARFSAQVRAVAQEICEHAFPYRKVA
jgi:hypothetical protein